MSASRLALAARMAGLGVLNEVLLRTLSLPRHLRLLDSVLRPGGVDGREAVVAEHVRVARWLFSGIRGPFRKSCLRQSLALFRTLRRAGVPVTIQFGVAPKGDGLDGHCWLELDGRPIAERDSREPRNEYRTLISYPEVS